MGLILVRRHPDLLHVAIAAFHYPKTIGRIAAGSEVCWAPQCLTTSCDSVESVRVVHSLGSEIAYAVESDVVIGGQRSSRLARGLSFGGAPGADSTGWVEAISCWVWEVVE